MSLYSSQLYLEDVNKIANVDIPWNKMKDKAILISGATGLLGSFLVDVLMQKNEEGLNCTVYALGRSRDNAEKRFSKWNGNGKLIFIPYNVNEPFERKDIDVVEYVLHLASNTHPIQYATDPIGTITTNIIGLQNMLDFAVKHKASRFAFTSSNEIYGENRGDVELFDESYCGYVDCNTLRAGYPESKRCGESLCQAYRQQKGLDVVIPRFTRSYGPTMKLSDSKAISQFIRNGVAGENIVLKSMGTQKYSFTYMADAIYGLLTVILCGKDGDAYNIADEASNVELRALAKIIADSVGTEVVFEMPDDIESKGYSRATKALLDGNKLKKLGWKPFYSIEEGIPRTIKILQDIT